MAQNTGVIVTGQVKVATTGTAVQISTANDLQNGAVVKALAGNAASVVVGASGVNNTVDGTGNGFILPAGDSISVPVNDLSLVYINGTAGDGVTFIAD